MNKCYTKILASRTHHLIMEAITSSDLQCQLRGRTWIRTCLVTQKRCKSVTNHLEKECQIPILCPWTLDIPKNMRI